MNQSTVELTRPVRLPRDRSFEQQLRQLVDRQFERDAPQRSKVQLLLKGCLPMSDVRTLFLEMLPSLLVHNRVLIAELLTKAPTGQARAKIVPIVAANFGDNLEDSYPHLFLRFLRALAVPEELIARACREVDARTRDEVYRLERMRWCELLGRLLVSETLPPVAFPPLVEALRLHYGVPENDLRYFTIHASQHPHAVGLLFRVCSEEAWTQYDRRALVDTVRDCHDQGRYQEYVCRLAATRAYAYAGSPLVEEDAEPEGGKETLAPPEMSDDAMTPLVSIYREQLYRENVALPCLIRWTHSLVDRVNVWNVARFEYGMASMPSFTSILRGAVPPAVYNVSATPEGDVSHLIMSNIVEHAERTPLELASLGPCHASCSEYAVRRTLQSRFILKHVGYWRSLAARAAA